MGEDETEVEKIEEEDKEKYSIGEYSIREKGVEQEEKEDAR